MSFGNGLNGQVIKLAEHLDTCQELVCPEMAAGTILKPCVQCEYY